MKNSFLNIYDVWPYGWSMDIEITSNSVYQIAITIQMLKNLSFWKWKEKEKQVLTYC